MEHGPEKVRELALELSRELPYSFGYVSLAFVSPSEMLHLIERYRGLDLYLLSKTSRLIGTGARGAYWLTFLGQPLLGQLGGLETLRRELDFPKVTVESLDGDRVLLRLGGVAQCDGCEGSRDLRPQMGVTLTAAGPFWPS